MLKGSTLGRDTIRSCCCGALDSDSEDNRPVDQVEDDQEEGHDQPAGQDDHPQWPHLLWLHRFHSRAARLNFGDVWHSLFGDVLRYLQVFSDDVNQGNEKE